MKDEWAKLGSPPEGDLRPAPWDGEDYLLAVREGDARFCVIGYWSPQHDCWLDSAWHIPLDGGVDNPEPLFWRYPPALPEEGDE